MRSLVMIFAASLALAAGAGTAPAQRAAVSATASPAAGSPQRRAILDALRPAVERRLGPDVEFVVGEMRVANGWAFVSATPQRRGGRPIDGSRHFRNFDEMDGLTVTALLHFRTRWTLVEHVIGATDAWYCGRGPSRAATGC
jgi:hypothetical protein